MNTPDPIQTKLFEAFGAIQAAAPTKDGVDHIATLIDSFFAEGLIQRRPPYDFYDAFENPSRDRPLYVGNDTNYLSFEFDGNERMYLDYVHGLPREVVLAKLEKIVRKFQHQADAPGETLIAAAWGHLNETIRKELDVVPSIRYYAPSEEDDIYFGHRWDAVFKVPSHKKKAFEDFPERLRTILAGGETCIIGVDSILSDAGSVEGLRILGVSPRLVVQHLGAGKHSTRNV